MPQTFDLIAESYDRWYDGPKGLSIFNAELKCIRSVCRHCTGHWLEVGVGTGRFASGLNIETGLDPSLPMLGIAKKRGIAACAGRAENLPFPDGSFDGILMALALCFIANRREALQECCRVLKPRGKLLIGIIPADSSWGKSYNEKKAKGHPVYASAHFSTISETLALIKDCGLTLGKAASTLFWNPNESPETKPRVDEGIHSNAGFIALLYTKNI